MAAVELKDVDIRVIDQRIGMGVGGLDTVIRILHRPTGIIIEMPRLCGSQFKDREAALEGLELMLCHVIDNGGFFKDVTDDQA